MPKSPSDFFSDSGALGRPNLPPSKQERKVMRKAARKLAGRSLWAISKALILHYGVTLAGVAVIWASGFQDVPRAALSATALGLLARWFLPNKATQAAFQKPPQHTDFAGVVELTPEQLREFFDKIGQNDGAEAPSGPSPYM